MGRGQLDEAAHWIVAAANAGAEKGELYLARFYRVTGYEPNASAGEDQMRQWNSWNKGVEVFTKLDPETLNSMIQIMELPPKDRQAAIEPMESEWKRLLDAGDEQSQEIRIELMRAALARIQGRGQGCTGGSHPQHPIDPAVLCPDV